MEQPSLSFLYSSVLDSFDDLETLAHIYPQCPPRFTKEGTLEEGRQSPSFACQYSSSLCKVPGFREGSNSATDFLWICSVPQKTEFWKNMKSLSPLGIGKVDYWWLEEGADLLSVYDAFPLLAGALSIWDQLLCFATWS